MRSPPRTRKKVFVTTRLPEEALNLLKSKFEVEVWPEETPPPKSLLIEKVKEIDGLCCLLTDKIDKEVIEAAGENLKVISQVAVGYDNIDVEAATRKGIYVTNTPGVLTDTTADFAFALLMATARRIPEADRYVRGGKWKIPWGLMMFLGQDVWGKTIGIIGLGRIGSAVARRAKGMNMRVLYYDIRRNEKLEREIGAEYVDLETLLRESDFVTIHVPLLPSTYHLINEERLRLMKPNAVLINTSRGPVVDEKALYKALKEGWIWAAGLDVWTEEPTDPKNPLLKLDNVVATPHIASASIETRTKMAFLAVENIIAALEGRVPPNLVNKEVLEKRGG
ncbi:D-glycerate dehydrogenase [Candidatus Bathyarchaeota archaeon]|nr:MAG: D-glycerate dehydrogenase [Candidatus Bathyarchaeota archaeon ex4484_40]RJS79685.1 MAG: D-glycerate dehydrogenase [Candidatus Bathyarchaeota archaeon]